MTTIQSDGKTYSILEKLKEELERRIKLHGKELTDNGEAEFLGDYYTLIDLLDFIDNLDKPVEKEKSWTPTPGEMIEVSKDGERWEKEPQEFFKMVCIVPQYETVRYEDGKAFFDWWKYARPLQSDKIEELPEFDWDWVMKQLEENQKLNLIPFTALAVMATHIGAMDKLIKANKK